MNIKIPKMVTCNNCRKDFEFEFPGSSENILVYENHDEKVYYCNIECLREAYLMSW